MPAHFFSRLFADIRIAWTATCAALVLSCTAIPAHARAPVAPDFWQTFRHMAVDVDGVRLHYVEGGHGAPVLLVPGWPESWFAWRLVMPALVAAGYHVIAVDPRGMGDSAHPPAGYDPATVAAELHAFIAATGLGKEGKVHVVSHDVGSWIAYALAADYPGDVARLVLMEAALPGVSAPAPAGIPGDAANKRTWHFAFNRLDDLPEILVQGHERAYLTWIFQQKANRSWAFSPDVIDEYVRVYVQPGGVRTAFSYYRDAFSPAALARNAQRAGTPLAMPVLAVGGEFGVGDALAATMRTAATHVSATRLHGCGHFVMEECPEDVGAAVVAFLRSSPAPAPR